jgi:hypothetical protein
MVVFCTTASPYYVIFEATFLFLLVEGGIGSRLLGVTLRVKLTLSPSIPPSLGRLSPLLWDL